MQPTLDIIAPFTYIAVPIARSITDKGCSRNDARRQCRWRSLSSRVTFSLTFCPIAKSQVRTNWRVEKELSNSPMISVTWKLYKLMLTAPISVAKDERTFSHLKFVKGVYRSTMADKRLDNLMILNCEKSLTDSLDMKEV